MTCLAYPISGYASSLRPVPIIKRAPGRRLGTIRTLRRTIQPLFRILHISRTLLNHVTTLTHRLPLRRLHLRLMPVSRRALGAARRIRARPILNLPRLAVLVILLLITRRTNRAIIGVNLNHVPRAFPLRRRRRRTAVGVPIDARRCGRIERARAPSTVRVRAQRSRRHVGVARKRSRGCGLRGRGRGDGLARHARAGECGLGILVVGRGDATR